MKVKPILFLALLSTLLACNLGPSEKKQKLVGDVWKVDDTGDSVLYRYDETSKLLSFTAYKNGRKHGTAKKFFESGKAEYIINYEDGFKNGITYWYYKTGKLYRETNYKNGFKHGLQKRYYEDGKIQAEIPYDMGEVQPGVKEYLKTGKMKSNYPEIVIQPVDKISTESRYTLKCSLSNGSKKVKFYKVARTSESFFKQELENDKGIGEMNYFITKRGSLREKVTIRAEYKSSLRIPVVIERDYIVTIDY